MRILSFFISFLLGTFHSYSQIQMSTAETSILVYGKSLNFKDADVAGSKYLNNEFTLAKVNKGNDVFSIRYNAFLDIMEFMKEGVLVELDKEHNKFFEFSNGDIYELIEYNLNNQFYSQYHKVLVDTNEIKVSVFAAIKLNKAKQGSNSYEDDVPATYKPLKPEYFITYAGKTVQYDGKQKTIESLFPREIVQIQKYFKNNKPKTNDVDMIALGSLLADFVK